MAETGFIKGIGIWYQRELNTIKKKDDFYLQPIFEAFTNALESIAIQKEKYSTDEKGSITINVYLTKNLFSKETTTFNFQKIIIEDTGLGFENSEFERFINLRDDRKGFSNKGTGRVQFLHAFDKTTFESIYKDEDSSTGFKLRRITLSKCESFILQNAIIRLDEEKDIEADAPKTFVIFETLLNQKDIELFKTITAREIKEELIKHYLAGFCEKRNNLPSIKIKLYIENAVSNELEIIPNDIPVPDHDKEIDIHYSKIDGNNIVKSSKKETFNLKSFVVPSSELDKNGLKLVSKGEVAKNIKLDNLLPTDKINDNRYLFLLSGKYIDERDSDTRGNIKLYKKKDFKTSDEFVLFSDEEILLEDIEEKSNQEIITLYKEIEERRKEKEKSIDELQQMFLLNPKTINSLQNKINIGDSDDTILRKVYEADAKIIAAKDAEIKQHIKELDELDTTQPDYQEKLSAKVDEFVKVIPIQNRTALTQYVARRKMVLDVFDKILKKEIIKLQEGGRIDEDLMHNLIFQQSSKESDLSDLWLIEEDFIYFRGFSESRLDKIEIDGVKIFKNSFSEEEDRYLNSLSEKRLTKRPDILLFPDEGKCIIIEFKAPDVNVSDHLSQIDFYANLIRNYTIDEFQITTFYGYLNW
ncbi:MAG TPA: ATP-binding protein [Bacteroidales bacterium]|nr:ATP-binding protein [Bacteroidales bacterium]